MPEIKQIERIIRILQRLASSHEVTVAQLYEMFQRQVPKRTLQRDLAEISAADIPLRTREGKGREQVWCIDPGYLKFMPATLGNKELLASHFLEKLSVITKGTTLERDIRSLLNKSRQLVSPEVFGMIEELGDQPQLFGATYTGYIDYSPHSRTIDTIIQAATGRQRCEFEYKANWRKDKSRFQADPYMLLYHRGAMYAIVYTPDHEHYIFLAVQRIQAVRLTDESFKRRKDFDLPKIVEGRFGIFGHEGLKVEKVVLKFRPEIADVVEERVWHPTQKLTRHKDGSLTLEMQTVVSDELRAWVGSWLRHVEVVRPKDLLESSDTIGGANVES